MGVYSDFNPLFLADHRWILLHSGCFQSSDLQQVRVRRWREIFSRHRRSNRFEGFRGMQLQLFFFFLFRGQDLGISVRILGFEI